MENGEAAQRCALTNTAAQDSMPEHCRQEGRSSKAIFQFPNSQTTILFNHSSPGSMLSDVVSRPLIQIFYFYFGHILVAKGLLQQLESFR